MSDTICNQLHGYGWSWKELLGYDDDDRSQSESYEKSFFHELRRDYGTGS